MTLTEQALLAWAITTNLACFVVFAWDKFRAGRGGRRVPEFHLALLGAIGGWPGGLASMLLFRHKTAKWSFWWKYGLALAYAAGRRVWG